MTGMAHLPFTKLPVTTAASYLVLSPAMIWVAHRVRDHEFTWWSRTSASSAIVPDRSQFIGHRTPLTCCMITDSAPARPTCQPGSARPARLDRRDRQPSMPSPVQDWDQNWVFLPPWSFPSQLPKVPIVYRPHLGLTSLTRHPMLVPGIQN